jgi:hypothetical protein
MRQRRPRQHDEKHLAFIRGLPCVVCGNNIQTEAAHIRYGFLRAGKRPTGGGEKPDDDFTVPLCNACHLNQHSVGELTFWGKSGIDAILLALALCRISGDQELGEEIVRNNAPTFADAAFAK